MSFLSQVCLSVLLTLSPFAQSRTFVTRSAPLSQREQVRRLLQHHNRNHHRMRREAEAAAQPQDTYGIPSGNSIGSSYDSPATSFSAPIGAVGASYNVNSGGSFDTAASGSSFSQSLVAAPSSAAGPAINGGGAGDSYGSPVGNPIAVVAAPALAVEHRNPVTPNNNLGVGASSASATVVYGSPAGAAAPTTTNYGSSAPAAPAAAPQDNCIVERTLSPNGNDCQQGGQVRTIYAGLLAVETSISLPFFHTGMRQPVHDHQ